MSRVDYKMKSTETVQRNRTVESVTNCNAMRENFNSLEFEGIKKYIKEKIIETKI